jgi:hypothetical protein
MSFQDPVVGGTVLRIPAIQSPNFQQSPLRGWSIQQNGNAYFGNVTVAGSFDGTDFIIDSGGVFFYSGAPATGNLQISLAAIAGTDAFGNTYPQGLSVNEQGEGQQAIVIGYISGGPVIYFPGTVPNLADAPGILEAAFGSGTAQQDAINILGPKDATHTDTAAFQAASTSRDGTQGAFGAMVYTDTIGTEHLYVVVNSAGIELNGPVAADAEIVQTFTADTTPMLMQQNTTVASTNGMIQQTHFSTGSVAWKMQVSGDAHSRYVLLADGSMQWGPGSAGQDTTLRRTAAGVLSVTLGSFSITTAGQGLAVKEGSNAKQGTAVLVAGSKVVANTAVTANSRIFLTSQVDGGTPGFVRVSTRTAGTSFTITSSSGTDTSTIAYEIFEPA